MKSTAHRRLTVKLRQEVPWRAHQAKWRDYLRQGLVYPASEAKASILRGILIEESEDAVW
jgi:hypothetical protein